MKTQQQIIEISTNGVGFSDITPQVAQVVRVSGVQTGMCTVFVRHTSASLVIQENADPAVLRDLERWMAEQVPRARRWEHDDEGPDDMPAHVRGAITKTSENVPIVQGRLGLGTWQGIYLWEHRDRPNTRQLIVHVFGD
ncbi:MAG: secondary thiamine-phosphate synthase enzyme YjbQ [Polyangiaceae bacterium]